MARIRQSSGSSGARKVPQTLWERAGARVGNGAGALFARLDAQDAQDAQDARDAAAAAPAEATIQREQAALALERLAAQIRAGAWSEQVAQIAQMAQIAALATKQPRQTASE